MSNVGQGMKRILVIGSGGAGKTIFSIRLAERLDLPLIHLDRHFWRAGWRALPEEEWVKQLSRMLEGESWIMDGNYAHTLERRVAVADTVLYLDFPRRVCIWRLLRRWWRFYGTTRPDIADGCPEHISLEFFRWVWRFRRDVRPRMLAALENAPSSTEIRFFTTQRQLDSFLNELGSPTHGTARGS